jgi:hypothetical protein
VQVQTLKTVRTIKRKRGGNREGEKRGTAKGLPSLITVSVAGCHDATKAKFYEQCKRRYGGSRVQQISSLEDMAKRSWRTGIGPTIGRARR